MPPLRHGLLLAAVLAALGGMGTLEARKVPAGVTALIRGDGAGSSAIVTGPDGHVILLLKGRPANLLPDIGEALPYWHRRIDLVALVRPATKDAAVLADLLRHMEIGGVISSVPLPKESADVRLVLSDASVPLVELNRGQAMDIGGGMTLESLKVKGQSSAFLRLSVDGGALTMPRDPAADLHDGYETREIVATVHRGEEEENVATDRAKVAAVSITFPR